MIKFLKDCNEICLNYSCPFLSLTEKNQKNSREDHICIYLKKRIYHRGKHPVLPPLPGCPYFLEEIEGDINERRIN